MNQTYSYGVKDAIKTLLSYGHLLKDLHLCYLSLTLQKLLREATFSESDRTQIPPIEIQKYFAKYYNSKAALSSPPHITIVPPFEFEEEEKLGVYLDTFCKGQEIFPITLNGYGCFGSHVIYINVERSQYLCNLKSNLIKYLKHHLIIEEDSYDGYEFTPHMTVAFKDLTVENFYSAWEEFKQKDFYNQFATLSLALLKYEDKQWHVVRNFFFNRRKY